MEWVNIISMKKEGKGRVSSNLIILMKVKEGCYLRWE